MVLGALDCRRVLVRNDYLCDEDAMTLYSTIGTSRLLEAMNIPNIPRCNC